jgi:hypothetical protein
MEQYSKDMLVAIPASIIFIIAGIAMIYWGCYMYENIHSLREEGVRTTGTILRYRRIEGPKPNEWMSVPIVEFKTNAGKTVVFEGTVDSILQNICNSGEVVEIIYDPNNPEHAVINTFAELWFAPLLSWVIGVGFIFGPPFTIWRHYKGLTR